MTMEATAYAFVSVRLWLVPDRSGEVFTIPRWCITEIDQRTEEYKWTAKKEQETNYDNLDTCLVRIRERIIEKTSTPEELPWEEGGFGSSWT